MTHKEIREIKHTGNTDELSLTNQTSEAKLNTMRTEQVTVTIKQEITNAETQTQ